jgi:hypothetical protein
MTPQSEGSKLHIPRLRLAAKLAHIGGCTTAMLTGKGEPTLHPNVITEVLERLSVDSYFPLIELQTNGLMIGRRTLDDLLVRWRDLGLTTIALSVAHWDRAANKSIYGSSYDLERVADKLHGLGFSVRLCCSMLHGYVDGIEPMLQMASVAKSLCIEQLTFTPINAPRTTANEDVSHFVVEHKLSASELERIADHFDRNASLLLTLAHGGRVYDVDGQNVCLNNCLTGEVLHDKSTMRNLIVYPDGAIRWDWEHLGARVV